MSPVSSLQKTEMSTKPKKERKLSGNAMFDLASLKESLALAEMKAAAASKEIVKNLDIKHQLRKLSGSADQSGGSGGYVPPKQLLLYLVRMGSFTSKPVVVGGEDPDSDLQFPACSPADLLGRCMEELGTGTVPPLPRPALPPPQSNTVRVLQWNQMSQTLATKCDKFSVCPAAALDWRTRRWRLLQEMLSHSPDILCLQEVDHFPLYQAALGSVGYEGKFVPKPDSPCIYMEGHSGPDGCAIFYRAGAFDLLSLESRTLQVWKVESNQVVMAMCLRHRSSGREVCVATTHLKARSGPLLAALRAEQGGDLLAWLDQVRAGRPLVLTGDLNAAPSESVISSLASSLQSAYSLASTEYTSWKVRESGEEKQVLDYIFHSAGLSTVVTLPVPTGEEIGIGRLPSQQFPSDHLSLVADIQL